MYFNKEHVRLYLVSLLVFQIVSCSLIIHFALAGQVDFRTFYTAGHLIRSGQVYDYPAELAAQNALVSPNRYALPFLYPPYAALLFAPFSLVSYKVAYFIFFLLNLYFCLAAATILRPYTLLIRARWRWAMPLLFLSFMPLGIALIYGQVSLFLLLLYCACFAAIQSEKPYLAGIFLSLALIKFQIALPIVLFFLLWRQWRFIAGFASGAVALALVSLRVTGLKSSFAYLHSVVSMAGQTSNESKFAMFITQMPSLHGFFHTISAGRPWGDVLTICFSLAVIVWTATRKPSLPLALLAAMLVSYHLHLYDLTLLLLPISLIFNAELASEKHNYPALYAAAFMVIVALVKGSIPQDSEFLFVIPVAILFLYLGPIGAIPTSTSIDTRAKVDQTLATP